MAEATCAVDDCDRPVRLAGWCGAHHQRVHRHGDPQAWKPLRGHRTIDGQRWCSRCREWKPIDGFYRNAKETAGVESVCRGCTNARRDEQSEHRKRVNRAWRKANPETVAANKRRYYQRNREAILARQRGRVRKPESIRAQNAARYALLKSAPGRCSTEQLQARWDYYGSRCWMCGVEATDTDHVKPLAAGGSNWPANLRPACASCNRSKSDTWPFRAAA